MERSLKLGWIKRIAENNHAAWKRIPEKALSEYGGFAFFTQCQYDINFCDRQNLPEFYRTILSYWQNFKLLTDDEKAAQGQIIWNNRNILVDGKPNMYKAWLKKGIIHIKDLFNEVSNFLSLTDLKAKFHLEIPYTVYYGLLNAIPASWKENIQNTDVSRVAPSEVVPSLLLPSTKIAYSTILGKSYSVPTAESKI